MSVFLEDVIVQDGRAPESVLVGYETNGLISQTAGWVRSLRQRVVRDPIPEEIAHAQVMGQKNSHTRKRLAKQYEWVVQPN
jgi:hypothetical protein